MKKWMLILLLPLLVMACKGKKKQLTDAEGITVTDFIEFFEEVKPPFTVADSTFDKKKTDTASINNKTFTSFVPDTLLHGIYGKNTKLRIYPLGKVIAKNNDTYLLIKTISASQKAAWILVFNKDNKFVAGMPLLVLDNNPATAQTAVMDNKFSITTNRQYKATDGKTMYKKAAYAYISSAEAFALILTESNETETKKELLNPIDTLARKNKLAGDYLQNKLNMVSVRDSKKPGELLFFIHFEKDEGGCRGELKGEAKIVSPTKAVYRQPGDQCVLEMSFAGNTVTLKEDGCGSHRDIKCFFEGRFVRKPPAKIPVKSTKPQKKKY
ncbi:MAG: hypothetical protein ABIQ88_19210 [Chitinophagaceae bacterium]